MQVLHLSGIKTYSEFRAVKTSRRDLAMVVSKRLHGGTTVSGTMLVSAIKNFIHEEVI